MRHSQSHLGKWAVFVFAFAVGNATAQKATDGALGKITLFTAMQRAHTETQANIIFANPTEKAATLERLPDNKAWTAQAAAKPFQKDAILVNGVYVLQDALPDTPLGSDRLKAAKAWLKEQFPADKDTPNGDDVDILYKMDRAIQEQSLQTAQGFGSNETPFATLNAAQQQNVLDLIRIQPYTSSALYLQDLLEASDGKFTIQTSK